MRGSTRKVIRNINKKIRISEDLVYFIISEYRKQLAAALNQGKDFQLPGIGTFHWRPARERKIPAFDVGVSRTIPEGYRLRFRFSNKMKTWRSRMPEQEDGMTKYGVEVDDNKVKQATEGSKGTHCPICLEELDNGGACPKHGTKPFERDR